MIFSYKRKIFGFECDVYGHLNNANYLHIFEEARTLAMEETAYSVAKLREMDIQIFVRKIELDYCQAVDYGKNYTIKSQVISASKVRSQWKQQIFSEKETLCSTLILDAVFAKNGKATRLPERIFNHFKSLL